LEQTTQADLFAWVSSDPIPAFRASELAPGEHTGRHLDTAAVAASAPKDASDDLGRGGFLPGAGGLPAANTLRALAAHAVNTGRL
jgi:hypothetical protein